MKKGSHWTDSMRETRRLADLKRWTPLARKETGDRLRQLLKDCPEILIKSANSRRGNPKVCGENNPCKRVEVREKIRQAHLGKRYGKYSDERIRNTSTAPVTHHRDFDHDNDFPSNRREMTRVQHNILHRQSGRRAVIFVKNALDKGVIAREFYEDFLAYINQEELKLSDSIAEEYTSEMIN